MQNLVTTLERNQKAMTRIKLVNIFIFSAFLFIVSCDRNKVFDSYLEVDSQGWLACDTIGFQFEIDTQENILYNTLIGLRNNNDYLYTNIFFFVDVENPSGIHRIDTLQYILAAPDGKWLGSGVGEIKFNLLKFKENEILQSGFYKYKIVHGMRDDVLIGIEDIGLRIERSN